MDDKITILKAWDGDVGEYVINHHDALIIREALKMYKKKYEQQYFADENVEDAKRLRKLFKIAKDGVY